MLNRKTRRSSISLALVLLLVFSSISIAQAQVVGNQFVGEDILQIVEQIFDGSINEDEMNFDEQAEENVDLVNEPPPSDEKTSLDELLISDKTLSDLYIEEIRADNKIEVDGFDYSICYEDMVSYASIVVGDNIIALRTEEHDNGDIALFQYVNGLLTEKAMIYYEQRNVLHRTSYTITEDRNTVLERTDYTTETIQTVEILDIASLENIALVDIAEISANIQTDTNNIVSSSYLGSVRFRVNTPNQSGQIVGMNVSVDEFNGHQSEYTLPNTAGDLITIAGWIINGLSLTGGLGGVIAGWVINIAGTAVAGTDQFIINNLTLAATRTPYRYNLTNIDNLSISRSYMSFKYVINSTSSPQHYMQVYWEGFDPISAWGNHQFGAAIYRVMFPFSIWSIHSWSAEIVTPHHTLYPTAPSFGVTANSDTIYVTSNAEWNAPTSDRSWLTISHVSRTTFNPNGSFRINAEPNNSGSSRTATVTVTGEGPTQTITVTQSGATLVVPDAPPTLQAVASNLRVPVTSNTTWSATSNEPWLTIDSFVPLNRTGDGSFRINAIANHSANARTAVVTVTSGEMTQTIMVTQLGVTLELPDASPTLQAVASEARIPVTSNSTWTVSSNETWLTINSFIPLNRTGDGSFRINATTNNLASERTADVTVTSGELTRTFTVTQPGVTLELPDTPPTLRVTASDAHIPVTSNSTWTASSNEPWLTINSFVPANRTGDGSFRVNAEANNTGLDRTAVVVVMSGGVTRSMAITQPGATLSISDTPPTLLALASNARIYVTSDSTWSATSSESWLTINSFIPANRTGDGSFRINAEANNTGSARTAVVVVMSGGMTQAMAITQPAATLALQDTPPTLLASANDARIYVTSDVAWSATSSESWLTLNSFIPANRTGNGSFRINAEANNTGLDRTAVVVVMGGGLTQAMAITQPAATITLSDVPSSFQAVASDARIAVESNTVWTVTSSESWLSINSFIPLNRTGDGSFRIHASANNTGSSRTAIITVTGGGLTRTLSISQMSSPIIM